MLTPPAAVLHTTVVFAEERMESVWDEALPLSRANHEETGALDGDEFAPHRPTYERLQAAGLLRLYTMRVDSALAGYAVFLVVPHLHYPGTLWARQDVLYVTPAHRGPAVLRFMRWTDERLAEAGVRCVYRHSTQRHPLGSLLERLGYAPVETGYLRRLPWESKPAPPS